MNEQIESKEQKIEDISLVGVISRVVYISFGFILVFSANFTFQTLAIQIFDQLDMKNLGEISIFVFYIFECIFCTLSQHISSFFTYRQVMWASAAAITIFVSFGMWIQTCSSLIDQSLICSKQLLYVTFIAFTAITGSIEALMWCSVSGYIDIYCKRYPQHNQLYFPVFFGVFQLVTVFGMAFAYLSFQLYSLIIFYFGLALFSFTGFIILYMLPEMMPQHLSSHQMMHDNSDQINAILPTNQISISQDQINIPLNQINTPLIIQNIATSEIASNTLNQGNVIQSNQRNISDVGLYRMLFSQDSKKSLIVFYQYIKSVHIQPYLLYFLQSGISIGFIMSVLYTIIQKSLGYSLDSSLLSEEESNTLNIKTTQVQLLLGLTEIIFYFSLGFIEKKVDQKQIIKVSYWIIWLSLASIGLAYALESITLCYLCGILWGMSDCIFLNQSYAICTFKLEGTLISYSLFNLLYGFGICLVMILTVFMLSQSLYLLLTSLFLISLLSFYLILPTIHS